MSQKGEYGSRDQTSRMQGNVADGLQLDRIEDLLWWIRIKLTLMENREMSRYSDLLEKVRGLRSQGAAIRELLRTLDAGSEAEYQALTAEIQANADEMAAAIAQGTGGATGPSGSTGGVGASGATGTGPSGSAGGVQT